MSFTERHDRTKKMLKSILRIQLIALLISLLLTLLRVVTFSQALVFGFVFTNVNYWISSKTEEWLCSHGCEELRSSFKDWLLSASAILVGIGVGSLISTVIVAPILHFQLRFFLKRIFFAAFSTSYIVALTWMTLETIYNRLKRTIERNVIEKEEIKRLQIRSHLQALQAKLNPHFLFNTLNTMLGLVHQAPERVEEMILNLSDLYRRILTFSEKEFITLNEEIELLREYLEIEKLRLGNRLQFEIKIPAELSMYRIPPLLLEPLVENAVIHGIDRQPQGGFVHIEAVLSAPFLQIRVEDNGAGIDETHLQYGYGIRSIKERLRLHFPSRSRLQIASKKGGGTTVLLEIKYETENDHR